LSFVLLTLQALPQYITERKNGIGFFGSKYSFTDCFNIFNGIKCLGLNLLIISRTSPLNLTPLSQLMDYTFPQNMCQT
jgi:hypothetical protein